VRVLYIVTAYPRSSDDVITPWLIETIRRLSQVGVEVEVLAPAYRGLGGQVVEGVRVHRFRYAPARWESLTHDQTAPDRIRERPWYLGLVPAYLAAGTVAAARLGRSGRFDLVHAFWPLPHAVLGVAAKHAGRIPLVSTFFGVELTWLRSSLGFLRPVLRRLIVACDAVTAISSYTAATLRELAPAAQPVVIPFGAAVEVGRAAEPLPRPASSPYTVLFVGRLVERKGVDVLLRALERLRPERDIRLRIVGDGPLRAQLEQRAREYGIAEVVHFLGLVPEAELAAQYAECDVFVLPAVVDAKGDTEGLGVVLLEALAHGKPVIASAVGGIPDIVMDGSTGQLVPPGDPGALATALRTYHDDPGLAARHAEAGRRHLEERFSWHGIIRRLVDLYGRTIASAPAGRARGRPEAVSPSAAG
jgi:glycosyltransferase involved in cell wall biosynthesis